MWGDCGPLQTTSDPAGTKLLPLLCGYGQIPAAFTLRYRAGSMSSGVRQRSAHQNFGALCRHCDARDGARRVAAGFGAGRVDRAAALRLDALKRRSERNDDVGGAGIDEHDAVLEIAPVDA